VLELWAYAALCIDTNDDVSKTKANIDTVKTDGDNFLDNCISALIDLLKIRI
jgi:hypothetical protein